jgi:hypothetical protein
LGLVVVFRIRLRFGAVAVRRVRRHLGRRRSTAAPTYWRGHERYLRHQYVATLKPSGEYRFNIPYRTDEELDKTMEDLLQHIAFEADLCNCFSESNAQLEGSQDRTW